MKPFNGIYRCGAILRCRRVAQATRHKLPRCRECDLAKALCQSFRRSTKRLCDQRIDLLVPVGTNKI
jgi:hypothetical protein